MHNNANVVKATQKWAKVKTNSGNKSGRRERQQQSRPNHTSEALQSITARATGRRDATSHIFSYLLTDKMSRGAC